MEEVLQGLGTSAAVEIPTLAALMQNLDYRSAKMVGLDPVGEAVMEKMDHCQDCSLSRGRDLSPVLKIDVLVPLAGPLVKILMASTAVVWTAAVV